MEIPRPSLELAIIGTRFSPSKPLTRDYRLPALGPPSTRSRGTSPPAHENTKGARVAADRLKDRGGPLKTLPQLRDALGGCALSHCAKPVDAANQKGTQTSTEVPSDGLIGEELEKLLERLKKPEDKHYVNSGACNQLSAKIEALQDEIRAATGGSPQGTIPGKKISDPARQCNKGM